MYSSEPLMVIEDTEKKRKVITKEDIKKGEDVCGLYFESIRPYDAANDNSVQRAEDAYLDSSKQTIDDFINHSCDPNTKINFSRCTFEAIKDIKQGEEITYNYLTTEYDLVKDNLDFECKCDSENCHGRIKGFKYLSEEQQMALWPYLSAFLRLKIAEESPIQ